MVHKLTFLIEFKNIPVLELFLEQEDITFSLFELDESTQKWQAEVFDANKNTLTSLTDKILNFLKDIDLYVQTIDFIIEELPEEGWLEMSYESLPALEIGRFYVYGSHITPDPEKNNLIPMHLEAATAFGTGSHETTKGCLLFLSELAEQKFNPTHILDMGCGSGILAMASHFLWPNLSLLLGVDCDDESIKVSHYNFEKNNIQLTSGQIQFLEADGYNADFFIRENPKFDLILSNILANPLIHMAPQAVSYLKKDGYIILAGLLSKQRQEVEQAYQQQGLILENSMTLGDWDILLMKKN